MRTVTKEHTKCTPSTVASAVERELRTRCDGCRTAKNSLITQLGYPGSTRAGRDAGYAQLTLLNGAAGTIYFDDVTVANAQ
jgi:hypothetical protein